MKIFIVELEPVETRYTSEWAEYFPQIIDQALFAAGIKNIEVISIKGPDNIPSAVTPGAFLNFGGTNIWKSKQIEIIAEYFTKGVVSAGDHFIFTDAWHPGIISIKYMSELLNMPVVLHGLWHAGSYDPQDFLGRLIGDKPWVRYAEKSFFDCFDHNYFATKFHVDLFRQNLLGLPISCAKDSFTGKDKMVRTGWPMGYMNKLLLPYQGAKKRNLILFPHRIAPEKQPEIFLDLQKELPQYDFIMCQTSALSKNKYHQLLSEAKLIFSANLQETLGISCFEGALVGAIPMVPDRLSYREMYADKFKYPSDWTKDYNSYLENKHLIKSKIIEYVEKYEEYINDVRKLSAYLSEHFFTCNGLLNILIDECGPHLTGEPKRDLTAEISL